MAQNKTSLSRLMRISWDIQKNKNKTRSKSLMQAWAIYLNEDITIKHLSLTLNRNKPVKQHALNQMGIFQRQMPTA